MTAYPSLYVHVPICLSKCDYCDFYSVPLCSLPGDISRNEASRVVTDALLRDVRALVSAHAISGWHTVYVGGGTPSLLAPNDVTRLASGILDGMQHPVEFTCEANPEDLTPEWLSACSRSGITRISVGVQSLNDRSLASVGRRGSAAATRAALTLLDKEWGGELSADLIASLPYQTAGDLISDIDELAERKIDHVSLYALTVEEGTPLAASVAEGRMDILPIGDEASDIWLAGRDRLEALGLKQYEVSNFARPGHESKHNLVYWNMGSWHGVGPSASGTVATGDRCVRTTITDNVAKWLSGEGQIAEVSAVSRDETIVECLMMGSRLRDGIKRKPFARRFGADPVGIFQRATAKWERLGLLTVNEETLALTGEGLLHLNAFLADCLAEYP